MSRRALGEEPQGAPVGVGGPAAAAPAGGSRLRVCVLDMVSIARPGQSPVLVGSLQQKIVLTLLVADPTRSVSIDRIADELWGEDKPPRWLASIRTLANCLRRAAGDKSFVYWTGRGYRLHRTIGIVDTDIGEMARLADEARVALDELRFDDAELAARQALASYGSGPWTTDCWCWGELAADTYSILGRALLAKESYLRCLLELSLAPEDIGWHPGLASCLQQAKQAVLQHA